MLLLLLFQAVAPVVADFQLFTYYNKASLMEAWNVTSSCIDALNTTVTCDETAAVMLGNGADYNYWYKENITKLCTAGCQNSLKTWGVKVESSCAGQTVEQSGVKVQAKALTLSFSYGTGLVCLQDTKKNWCFYDSQSWQGSDVIRWDPAMCWDTQDLPAKCKEAVFDMDEISPEMSAMTNLYDATLYCSECFLGLMRQRLLDPWLVKSNHTDYLIGEFDRMQKKCSTSLPYTTSSSTLLIATSTTSFGECCSIYGFCGSTSDFCGAGNCYSGKCATDIGGPSINGECGPSFAGNKTCTGTQFGKCCSTSGYCGSTSDYCAAKNCYSGSFN